VIFVHSEFYEIFISLSIKKNMNIGRYIVCQDMSGSSFDVHNACTINFYVRCETKQEQLMQKENKIYQTGHYLLLQLNRFQTSGSGKRRNYLQKKNCKQIAIQETLAGNVFKEVTFFRLCPKFVLLFIEHFFPACHLQDLVNFFW
jgi:hypothetical protein